MLIRKKLMLFACGSLALATPTSAFAQSQEYKPVGARVGGFVLKPQIELSGVYDSNIFLEEAGESSDFISIIEPVLRFDSDWNRHSLGGEAGVEGGFYADSNDDDYVDFWLLGRGEADVTRATQLFADRVGVQQEHEARGSDDVIFSAAEPVVYHRYGGIFGARHKPNRASVEAEASLFNFDYSDTDLIGGGELSGAPRDRNEYEFGLRFGYDIQPDYEAFLKSVYMIRDYDLDVNAGGFDRDSEGYQFFGGVEFEPSPLVRASVGLGYMEQDYDDPSLGSVDGPLGAIDATWFATPLTTLFLSLSSDIEETTSPRAAGRRSYDLTLNMEHELLRNLVLTGGAGAGRRSYEGGGSDRVDDDLLLDLGAQYWLNRNIYARADYEFEQRNSNTAGFDYVDHKLGLTLGGQF